MITDELDRSADTRAPGDRAGTVTLGRRIRQPQTLLSFLFAILIIVFLVRQLDIDPGHVWRQIRSANPALFALGLVTFYAGFVLRALRWRYMLRRAGVADLDGVRLPSLAGFVNIMLLAWFANCVVPAKLGDAYRGFLLKRRSNAPFTTSMGTIAAERLIDLVVLLVLLVASGLVVFGRHFPSGSRTVLVYGGATTLTGLAVISLVWTFRDRLMGLLPDRLAAPVDRVQMGLFENLRSPWVSVGYSLVIWTLDATRLFFVAWSLDARLPFTTALFLVLVGSLAAVSPITPAGLGVVEVVLISVLQVVGVPEDVATAITVLERVISYWSLIVVGVPLYVLHFRRDVAAAPHREPSSA